MPKISYLTKFMTDFFFLFPRRFKKSWFSNIEPEFNGEPILNKCEKP